MAVLDASIPVREPPPAPGARPARVVVGCYSVMDAFFPRLGLFDLTEGIYDGPDTSYEQAQANQFDYLLDRAGCGPGTRLLDIGCGYGTLLARACRRGTTGAGITLSRPQAEHCRRAGLDVRVLDPDGDGEFDAVIANGSLEHFVQPADAAAGRDSRIYREMFRTAHRMIDPDSPARRFVTTAIHFVRRPDPADLLRHPLLFRPGRTLTTTRSWPGVSAAGTPSPGNWRGVRPGTSI